MRLQALNAMVPDAADRAFLRCCGSTRWARAMTAARPFASAEAIVESADKIWDSLGAADWQEAFAAHPRIGEKGTGWSAEEQSLVRSGVGDVRARLSAANRDYEARFGYIFIVCATGRSAGELLTILEQRLRHDHDTELAIAGEEQRTITHLRIARLLDQDQT